MIDSIKDHLRDQTTFVLVLCFLLIRMCVFDVGYPDAIIFVFSVLAIIHLNFESSRREEREAKYMDQSLTSMQNQIDLMRADHSKILKVTEETKKALTDVSLAGGFVRPKRQ